MNTFFFYDFYITENPYSPNPNYNFFEIELQFTHSLQIFYPENQTIPLLSHITSYRFPRNSLQSPDLAPTLVSSLLDVTGSPCDVITQIVDKVLSFALEIDQSQSHPSDYANTGLTMILTISAITPYDDREQIDRILTESMQLDQVGLINFEPANDEAIEELEREKNVVDKFVGVYEECIICLEEFKVGCDSARMPCGHVYHDDCIVRWLRTSRLCPLCRYSMPAA